MSAPRAGRGARAIAALSAALLGGLLAAAPATAAGEVRPGAYCPLPQAGVEPACLDPARAEYDDFFAALEAGDVDDAESLQVEADVAGGGASVNAYLALSSLSYGYYRLAQQAASAPAADPATIARLERWNALLARAYATSADDRSYREAVHAAASDLHRRARVRVGCVDAEGQPAECDSTEAVLRGFDAVDREVGIRGALRRLLARFLGTEDS